MMVMYLVHMFWAYYELDSVLTDLFLIIFSPFAFFSLSSSLVKSSEDDEWLPGVATGKKGYVIEQGCTISIAQLYKLLYSATIFW